MSVQLTDGAVEVSIRAVKDWNRSHVSNGLLSLSSYSIVKGSHFLFEAVTSHCVFVEAQV